MSMRSTMGALGSASSWAARTVGRPRPAAASAAITRIRFDVITVSPVPLLALGGKSAAAVVLPVVEGAVLHADLDGALGANVPADEGFAQRILDVALDGATQGPRAVRP